MWKCNICQNGELLKVAQNNEDRIIRSRPEFGDTIDHGYLKSSVISCGQQKILVGRKYDLSDHLDLLFHEFSGSPLISFYHASLIVRIRRGEKLGTTFRELWVAEGEFLIKALSLRWLVSACDTIVDSELFEPADRAFALSASLLTTSVKLYESEYKALCPQWEPRAYRTINIQPLFDGLTTFSIGYGDTVSNLMKRVSTVAKNGGVAGSILQEVLRRLHINDTVFKRFLQHHVVESTRWTP